MDAENAIGFELKAARERKGMSQREAAAALAKVPGLGDATSLSMRERGLREWSVGQYIAACELYDADPAGMLASILSSRPAQPVLHPGSGVATT